MIEHANELTIRELGDHLMKATEETGSLGYRKYRRNDFVNMLPDEVTYFEMKVPKANFILFLKDTIQFNSKESIVSRTNSEFSRYIENGSIMLMDSYQKLDKNTHYYIFAVLSDNSKPVNTGILLVIPPGSLTESFIKPINITCEF